MDSPVVSERGCTPLQHAMRGLELEHGTRRPSVSSEQGAPLPPSNTNPTQSRATRRRRSHPSATRLFHHTTLPVDQKLAEIGGVEEQVRYAVYNRMLCLEVCVLLCVFVCFRACLCCASFRGATLRLCLCVTTAL